RDRRDETWHGDEQIAAGAAELAADDPAGDAGRLVGDPDMLRPQASDRARAVAEPGLEAAERRLDPAAGAGSGQRGDVAEETRREQRARPRVELFRRAELHEPAGFEQHDPVGDP